MAKVPAARGTVSDLGLAARVAMGSATRQDLDSHAGQVAYDRLMREVVHMYTSPEVGAGLFFSTLARLTGDVLNARFKDDRDELERMTRGTAGILVRHAMKDRR